jgi:hypothetical protein
VRTTPRDIIVAGIGIQRGRHIYALRRLGTQVVTAVRITNRGEIKLRNRELRGTGKYWRRLDQDSARGGVGVHDVPIPDGYVSTLPNPFLHI